MKILPRTLLSFLTLMLAGPGLAPAVAQTPADAARIDDIARQAARRFAEQMVARQKVRELKPTQHQAAERRAGKRALEAAAKGKTDEAVAAKRDQLLNFYAAKETATAIEEVDKGVAYLRKVASMLQEYRLHITKE